MKRTLALLYHDVYAAEPGESGFAEPGAQHYKIPLRDFESQLDRLAATEVTVPLLLTVDDGGMSFYTQVAERLEARGWRGHCFMTTGWIGRKGFLDATQLRELHARGHVIGSHSVTHPRRFAALAPVEMLREWSDSRKALQDILSADVGCASVPGGYFSRRVAVAARAAGFTRLFTSEPEMRVRDMAGCQVYGRYTLRRGDTADLPARLARGEVTALWTAWLAWNGKKALKAALGASYPKLARFAQGRYPASGDESSRMQNP